MHITAWKALRIKANSTAIARLDQQRIMSGSALATLDHWNISELIGRDIVPNHPVTFEEMMPLWVGKSALQPVGESRKKEYTKYLWEIIGENRYSKIVDELATDRGELIEADLSPPHDLLLIEYFIETSSFEQSDVSHNVMLEVGGGYGRLAEMFLRELKQPFTYILADAVPESIYYSYAYLTERCPSAKIYASFGNEPLPKDLSTIDVLVIPAWRIPEIETNSIDLIINIASIQEMPDISVRDYFFEFSRLLREGGLFFFENSREYAYRREYEFPENWRYLLKNRSPRSRTLNYPVDILKVYLEDQRKKNYKIEFDYYNTLSQLAIDEVKSLKERLRAERKRSRDIISTKNNRIKMLQERLRVERKRSQDIISTKNNHIRKLQEAIAKTREKYLSIREKE